ncbi:unnamed protein product [Acanthoscelides obtectus]|uniref:Uncharacterized protein n=1 Tax=Acanthoscelides obtectus TaxID=200917 RepID=A0A9P0PFC3_ACAOB|nr:unnamed protein product [Acanthoscelides obtectus]CAK1676219.1 hypothetical protein AOBTE_LOCUS30655 [Acanthoscelides obtectus]
MMHDQQAPKVVVNEDYVDLRRKSSRKTIESSKRSHVSSSSQHNESNYLQTNGLRHEKELINCALKKLATSYTTNLNKHQKQGTPSVNQLRVKEKSMIEPTRQKRHSISHEGSGLKSQSDISFCNVLKKNQDNSGIFRRKCSVTNISEPEVTSVKTVSKNTGHIEKKCASKKDENRRHSRHQRAKSKDFNDYHATTYVDRKLSESYCPNKTIEWKRSWTLPVFTPKTESKRKNADADNFDRTTYLYDDGTDIDSACLQSDKNKIIGQEPCTSMVGTLCTMAFEKQFMVLLFIIGSLCGFLLVSLCIWLLFGNELLDVLLKPRPKQYRIAKYFNYLGNGITRIITAIFGKIGQVLVMPVQQVYQPTDNIWPLNRL